MPSTCEAIEQPIDVAIRAACRLSREKSPAVAFDFLKAIGDGNARLEVLRYVSASAAHAGHGAEIERLMGRSRLSSTEQAAVLRGLTEGLVEAGAKAGSPLATASAATP